MVFIYNEHNSGNAKWSNDEKGFFETFFLLFFLSCPKFSIHQMRNLLEIMYPSECSVAFDSINEMIEMLIVAAFYDIKWIVQELENCLFNVICPKNPRTGAPRRDLSRDEKIVQVRVFKNFVLK